jgi:dipeptidase E
MQNKTRLLLLSSSRTPGCGFLEHAREYLQGYLGPRPLQVLFIPYAAVSRSYAEMARIAGEAFGALGYGITSLHEAADPVAAVRSASAIAVSGGNTFRLLQLIQSQGLLQPLRERVQSGVPYIGWSAGSNLACPTIRTTNDMPVIWPSSYEALGLIPFQINPHYTELLPPEHQGETRDDRLKEFMLLNPGVPVLALRDPSALRLESGHLSLLGSQNAKLFLGGNVREVSPQDSLQFLLSA